MTINCNNNKMVLNLLINKEFITFFRGSRLYKTFDKDSDFDFGIIIPDEFDIIDMEDTKESEKADNRLHNCVKVQVPNSSRTGYNELDIILVKKHDLIDMIKEHTPFALEAVFSVGDRIKAYREYFEMDKWKLRESFGSIASNSWAKAHKKMTVEEDLDMYKGAKSLFHSIRLLKLACQISKLTSVDEELVFTECNNLWNDIKADLVAGKDWEFFNEKYKPIYNEAHSELVKLCPKPEEKTKKSRKKKAKKDEQL